MEESQTFAIWGLFASMVLCALPVVAVRLSQEGCDDIKYQEAVQWQRACTIHGIICGFYLLDLTFDVVVTGLRNNIFVIYNFCFYTFQMSVSIICRFHYSNSFVGALVSAIDSVFVIWFLTVQLTQSCPSVWDRHQRRVSFFLAACTIFLSSLIFLFQANKILVGLTGAVLCFAFLCYVVGCLRSALLAEANAISKEFSVNDKRSCILIVCMALYYSITVTQYFGYIINSSSSDRFPSAGALYVNKFVFTGIAVLVSYMPWRVSTRSFIEYRVSDF